MEILELNWKEFSKCHTPALRLPLKQVSVFKDSRVVVEFTA